MTPPATAGDPKSEADQKIHNGSAIAVSPSHETALDSEDGSVDEFNPSKTKRLSNLRSRAKARTKELLNIDTTGDGIDSKDDQEGPLNEIDHDPAFNPNQLTKKNDTNPTASAGKTRDALRNIGSIIAHPKGAIKGKVTQITAGQLSKSERPFLSKKTDLDYLEAHDNLSRAESTSSSKQGICDEEEDAIIGSHKDRLQQMEANRDSLRAAWTTSRHVRRVRVVPKRHLNLPEDEFFVERDANGLFVRYDWLRWLGYNMIYYTQDFSAQYIDDFDELPFSVDGSRHYIERLVMASAPWQSWAMRVRSVYRRENPRTTGRWFALYIFLWHTEHIMGFFYCYIIYIVIKNRFYPTSVESIRSSLQRAQDSRSSAYKFGELIDKHGRSNWLEPLMADLGPYIQLQLCDMANMLEVLSNFYHWKSPRKTAATLMFFTSCLLMSLFTDMAFCMKMVYFVTGGAFFVCFPIASRYPKYRYLVSPFKWVLWDIPNHEEWSFQYLRRKGQEAREKLIKQKVERGRNRDIAEPAAGNYTGRVITIPKISVDGDEAVDDSPYDSDDSGFYSATSTTSVMESSDIRSFHAHEKGIVGRFIVFSKGVRFVRRFKKKEMWRYDFLELEEMRKVDGTRLSKIISSPNQMEIKCIDESTLFLEGMRERDEAFNAVIAFSNLQWQSLQVRENSQDQEE